MKIRCLIIVLCMIHGALVAADETVHLTTQVCVVGGGSGGIGAALAAARAGAQVVLIEKRNVLGGTGTLGFVNNWEPGPDSQYAFEIYRRMSEVPQAIAITKDVRGNMPYGVMQIDTTATYFSTLRRSDLIPPGGVVFNAEQFDRVIREMLQETQRCKLLFNTSFVKAHIKDRKIVLVEAISKEGVVYQITADVFVDCTGDLLVCRDAGCEYMLGADPASLFNEPSAPETGNNDLNAISLCYRIRYSPNPEKAIMPEGDFKYGHATAVAYDIPGKKDLLSINPLGIMEGSYLIEHGYDSAYQHAKKIVDHHWAHLQTFPHFKNYEFDSYAPMLGIRESYRLSGEYILTQHDLLQGYLNQEHTDIIALADHPMDVHGSRTVLSKLQDAYGIPYRCLIPKGWDNVLVASRSAGFSQIAASSCRLSRTILAIGQAAGFAACLSSTMKIPVKDVPVERIQAEVNLKLRPKHALNAMPQPINETIGHIPCGFLFSDNGQDSLFSVSSAGRITWRYFARHVQDLQILDNGNLLFSYYDSEQEKGGACETDTNSNVVFQYEMEGEVHTCQRLKNGNTLIGDNKNGQLIEVNTKGKVVRKVSLITGNLGHSCMRIARQLNNGNYLVCQEGDRQVAEYNKKGKLLHTIQTNGKCFNAIRMENGNTLVSEGDACTISEYDSQGQLVWRFSGSEYPELKANWFAGLQILPNGNMLVCNWLGHGAKGTGIPLFELNKNKKITFYYLNNEHLISNVVLPKI